MWVFRISGIFFGTDIGGGRRRGEDCVFRVDMAMVCEDWDLMDSVRRSPGMGGGGGGL